MRNDEILTVNLTESDVSSTSQISTGSKVNPSASLTIILEGEISSSAVVEADLVGIDGVVHKVGAPLLPGFFLTSFLDLANQNGASTFAQLVRLVPNLGEIISNNNNVYTILAPTDDAFSQLPDETFSFLTNPSNVAILNDTLCYHIIPEVIPSFQFVDGPLVTLQGGVVSVVLNPSGGVVISFNDNSVDKIDLLASNGILHTLDGVLLPVPLQSPTSTPLEKTPSPTIFETQAPVRSPRRRRNLARTQ
jgi:uncharacterized surface protein with fasciclin (FAS1) repeats